LLTGFDLQFGGHLFFVVFKFLFDFLGALQLVF
jgi:hypothetical protein